MSSIFTIKCDCHGGARICESVIDVGRNRLKLRESVVCISWRTFFLSRRYGPCFSQIYKILSIVKPTRCTSVSNLFVLEWHPTCFGRSFRLSSEDQDCKYSNGHLSDSIICMTNTCLLYVQSWTPDDGRKDRPKHVGCHSKIKKIWYIGASSWFYYRNNITMHGPMNVKLQNTCFQNT